MCESGLGLTMTNVSVGETNEIVITVARESMSALGPRQFLSFDLGCAVRIGVMSRACSPCADGMSKCVWGIKSLMVDVYAMFAN